MNIKCILLYSISMKIIKIIVIIHRKKAHDQRYRSITILPEKIVPEFADGESVTVTYRARTAQPGPGVRDSQRPPPGPVSWKLEASASANPDTISYYISVIIDS